MIEPEPDLVVVAQAATRRATQDSPSHPDVIVTDIDLSDANDAHVIMGSWRSRRRLHPGVHPGRRPRPGPVRPRGRRTNGYLLDAADVVDLLDGIRAIADGHTYLQPSLGVDSRVAPRPLTQASGCRRKRSGSSACSRSATQCRGLAHLWRQSAHDRSASRPDSPTARSADTRRARRIRTGRRTPQSRRPVRRQITAPPIRLGDTPQAIFSFCGLDALASDVPATTPLQGAGIVTNGLVR